MEHEDASPEPREELVAEAGLQDDQPSSNEVEAGMARSSSIVADDANPSHDNAAAEQQVATEGQADEDEDDFGDFDEAPANDTQNAHGDLSATEHQQAHSRDDAGDDDDFGDFTSEPEPAAGQQHHTVSDQQVPATPALAVNLMELKGEELRVAIAQSWAIAFGTAKVATSSLEDSELQLLRQHQQQTKGLPQGMNSSTIAAYVGIPLEIRQAGDAPPLNGVGVYQAAVQCDHESSWTRPRSEARLLQSLGLAEVAAQARSQPAPVKASSSQDVCKDLFDIMLLQGKQAEVVRRGQSVAKGVVTSLQTKHGEGLLKTPNLPVTLTAPTLSHWQASQQLSSSTTQTALQTSDLLGLSQEPTTPPVAATPPRQRSMFASWREDQRQWEEKHGSPHPHLQPVDTAGQTGGSITPVSPARCYVPHDPTVVPIEPCSEDAGDLLLGDELPPTNAFCISSSYNAEDDALFVHEDSHQAAVSETVDAELELAVERHLDAMSQQMQAVFDASSSQHTESEHLTTSTHQPGLHSTEHGISDVPATEQSVRTTQAQDAVKATQSVEQSSEDVDLQPVYVGSLQQGNIDKDMLHTIIPPNAATAIQDLTDDSFLDTAPIKSSEHATEYCNYNNANCLTANTGVQPSIPSVQQQDPALSGRSISYPPVQTSWSVGCDESPLDVRSISHTEQTAQHQLRETRLELPCVAILDETGTPGLNEARDSSVAVNIYETSTQSQAASESAFEDGTEVVLRSSSEQQPVAASLLAQTQQPAESTAAATESTTDHAGLCDETAVANPAPTMTTQSAKDAQSNTEQLDLGKALHAAVLAVEDATNTAAAVVAALSVLDHITTSTTVILNSVSPPASIKTGGFAEGDEVAREHNQKTEQAELPSAAVERTVASLVTEADCSSTQQQVSNNNPYAGVPATFDSITISQVGSNPEQLLSRDFAIKWLTNTCFEACEPSSKAPDCKACLEGKPAHVVDGVCSKITHSPSLRSGRSSANTLQQSGDMHDEPAHVTSATARADATENGSNTVEPQGKEDIKEIMGDHVCGDVDTNVLQSCQHDLTPAAVQHILEGNAQVRVHAAVHMPCEMDQERSVSNLQQEASDEEDITGGDDVSFVTCGDASPNHAAGDTSEDQYYTADSAADTPHCISILSIQPELNQAAPSVPEVPTAVWLSQRSCEPCVLQPTAVTSDRIPSTMTDQGSDVCADNVQDDVPPSDDHTNREPPDVKNPNTSRDTEQSRPPTRGSVVDTSTDQLVTLQCEVARDHISVKCIIAAVGHGSDSTGPMAEEVGATEHNTAPDVVVALPGVDDDVFGRLLETSVALDPAVSEDPLAVLEAQFGQTLMQALQHMGGRSKALKTQQQLSAANREHKPDTVASRPLPDPFEGLLDYDLAAQVAIKALDRAVGMQAHAPDVDPEEAAQAQALMNALQQGLFRDLVSDLHAKRTAIARPEGMVAAHEAEVLRKHYAWVAKCEAEAAEAAVQKARQRELEAERRAAEIEEAASKAIVASVVTAVFGSVFLSAATNWAPELSPKSSPASKHASYSKQARSVVSRSSTPPTVIVADSNTLNTSYGLHQNQSNTSPTRSPAAQVTGRFPSTYSPSRFYSQCSEPEITPIDDDNSEAFQKPARQMRMHSAADIVSAWASSSVTSKQDTQGQPGDMRQQLQPMSEEHLAGENSDMYARVTSPEMDTNVNAQSMQQQPEDSSLDARQNNTCLLIQLTDSEGGDVEGCQPAGDGTVLHGVHSWERFDDASDDRFPSHNAPDLTAMPLPRLAPQSSAFQQLTQQVSPTTPTDNQSAVMPGADVDSEEEANVQRLTRLLSAGVASPRSIHASPSAVETAKRRLSQTMPPLQSNSERRPGSLGGRSNSNQLSVNIMDDLSMVQVVDLQSVGLLPSPAAAKSFVSVADSPRIGSRPPSSRGWSMSPRPPLQLFDEPDSNTYSSAITTTTSYAAPQDQLPDLRPVVDAKLGHAVEPGACSQMLMKSLHVPHSPPASPPAPPDLWLKTFRSATKPTGQLQQPAGHSAPSSQSDAADSPHVGAVWHHATPPGTPGSSVANEDQNTSRVIPALQELDPLASEHPMLNHGRPVNNMMRPSSHTRMQLDVYSQLTARRVQAPVWSMGNGGLLDQAWAGHLQRRVENKQTLSPRPSSSTVASMSSYSSATWSAPPAIMVGLERATAATNTAAAHYPASDASQQQGMPAEQQRVFEPRRLF